jgi:hypothetical protein
MTSAGNQGAGHTNLDRNVSNSMEESMHVIDQAELYQALIGIRLKSEQRSA